MKLLQLAYDIFIGILAAAFVAALCYLPFAVATDLHRAFH